MSKNNTSQISKSKSTLFQSCRYLLDELIHHNPIGIFICDESGKILEFNPAAEEILGYLANEVRGKELSVILSDIPTIQQNGKSKLLSFEKEISMTRKDGKSIYLSLKLSEIKAKNKILYIGYFRDLEKEKKSQAIIKRQQQELMELSTPVIQIWDDILALPLIGTLDSARTQVVMENLLNQIVQTSASIAILDISGVPTVDTLVAQHLIKTVNAARLMGAECIISGIRPEIAQTMVHLGIDLSNIITKSSMKEALRLAYEKLNFQVIKN
ncbi:MAG: PAS domain S-box protein [Calditrichaeota bacterium]|nr:MAG: PAS domain S-box protein [Calditrichota bacterium]